MDNESVDNVNIDEDEAQNEGDNDMATNNDQEEKNKTDDEESVTLSSASTKPAHQPIANFEAIKQLINPFSGDKDFRSNDVLEFRLIGKSWQITCMEPKPVIARG